MTKPYISVVIPVYNEEKRLAKCFEQIDHYFSSKQYEYEIIFVNDGSKDKTRELIEQKIKNKPRYRLLNNEINRGKGYSVRRGVLFSKGRYILFADADLSTPIKQLELLIAFIKDFPIVIGSRYLKEDSIKVKQPIVRKIISRLGNIMARSILALPFVDTQCGFKLFESQVARDIFSRSTIDGWGFDLEVLAIAKLGNFPVKEVAVDWYNDPQSQLRAGRAALDTLKELIRIRFNTILKKYHLKKFSKFSDKSIFI